MCYYIYNHSKITSFCCFPLFFSSSLLLLFLALTATPAAPVFASVIQ